MEKNVSPKVRYIMNSANEEAKNCGDKQIRPEHIIISMILDSENKGVMLLNQMNVNIDSFYEDLDNLIKINQNSISQKLTNKFKLPFSSDSKKMLNNLDDEADKLNDAIIDTSHLILAMLKIKNGKLIGLFKKNGITYTKYRDNIKNYKSGLSELDYELKKIEDLLKNENLDMNTSDDFNDSFKENNKKRKTSSKTPALDNFCVDISKSAEKNELDPVVGRVNEIKRVSQILSRRKKNNPVLIGEPGVGKSAIIEGLAMLIKNGKAPRIISNKRIYSLDLASIVAGTKFRGQFEERMKAILDELKTNKDVVLFIDEMHTIVGAGNSSGGMDAANIFKPALARGEIQVIGATTLDEFRENIEKDGALTRRFQQVLVEEPTIEETKHILNNIKESYENHHKVKYTDEAIEECVKMSDRYISHRAMPDKAIDVLDEAGASRNINQETPDKIKKLETEKEFINQEKMRVVKEQQYEEAAELRDKERKVNDALLTAKEDWLNNLDSHRPVVDVEHVSEVISMMTGIPVSKISSQETKKLLEMDKMLCGKIIGQDKAVQKVVNAIKRNRLGIKDKTKPISSFIFLGPTGVGKTMLSKLLAQYMFGDSDTLIRMDMSEYMEKHSVSRLIGPPPGYVGYEEGGQLTEKVRRKPYSVVLFDEIEKAHPDVFNILLQLLDEGQLTDGLGRKIDFKNCLIILTSNIGVKEANSFGKSLGFETTASIVNEEERARSIIKKALKKKFKPEFLNRIDDTIIFNSLKQDEINLIILNEIENLKDRMVEVGYKIKVNKSAVDFVAKEGYDEAYGARPLNRAIQRYIEDPIADAILNGNYSEGDLIKISYDKKSKKIVLN